MTYRSQRLVAALTVLALVLTVVPAVTALAAPDIEGHWAQDAIEQLVEVGAVSGLPDGTFRPDLTVTRSEFVTMVNKSLGITPATGSSRFKDVKPDDWFAGQVGAAAIYGYVAGNPDGTFDPYRPITREQAAAMLVRAFGLSKLATEAQQNAVLASFIDDDKVSVWAKADVATAVSLGLLSGYTPTTLAPQPADLTTAGWQRWEGAHSTEQREAVLMQLGSHGLITRGQIAAVLVRALALEPEIAVSVFDKAGTYGPEEGIETISGDVIVKADGVTLQNLIITDDLIIDDSVGDGTVVLENVTVKGDTEVKGGGTDSVIFRDCTLHGTVTVEKVDGKIRIVAEGSTSVPKVVLQSGAILISQDDGSFERVELPKELAKGTEVVLTGSFAEVEIAAENANVTVGEDSTIDELVLSKNATGTQVELEKKANVNTFTANAKVEITGQGSIATAEINIDGVVIEQKPDKIVLEEGIKANVDGKDVSEPQKSTGGGSSKSPKVPVSGISVDLDIMLLSVDQTETIAVTVSPSNATNKKVNWTTSDANVATVDENGQVTAKAPGTATITVTPTADSTQKAIKQVIVGDLLVPAHGSIQKVIDDAQDGQVIAVAPGEYKEQLTIDKPLTLLGPNAAITGVGERNPEAVISYPEEKDTNAKSLLNAISNDVAIKGFSFENTYAYKYKAGDATDELYFEGEDIVFENNRVKVWADKLAIRIRGPIPEDKDPTKSPYNIGPYDGVVVKNNYVEGLSSTWGTVYIQGIGGTIEDNTIIAGVNGLQIQPYSNAVDGFVRNNQIAAYKYSIWHNFHNTNDSSEVRGEWIYEDNTLTPNAPIDKSKYAEGPHNWIGVLFSTGEPEVEFAGNTFDGSNAFEDIEGEVLKNIWKGAIGIWFWTNIDATNSVFDITDNVFESVTVGIQKDVGNADMDQILEDNTFPEGSQVIGSEVKVFVPEENTVYNKNTGAEYTIIQTAINEASIGDTILVGPGEYEEDITLGFNNLILRGPNAGTSGYKDREDEAVIVGTVEFQANNITFDGFTVNPKPKDTLILQGWPEKNWDEITIRNNRLLMDKTHRLAIWLQNNDRENLRQVTVTGNYIEGPARQGGIDIIGTKGSVVSGNHIINTGENVAQYGIWVVGNENVDLNSNRIEGWDDGLIFEGNVGSSVTNNLIEDNNIGVLRGDWRQYKWAYPEPWEELSFQVDATGCIIDGNDFVDNAVHLKDETRGQYQHESVPPVNSLNLDEVLKNNTFSEGSQVIGSQIKVSTWTGAGSYEAGAEIALETVPSDGYVFVNWTGGEGEASTENPYAFTMGSEALELTADFTEEESLADEEELGELDITPLETVIEGAIAAKGGITVSEDGQDVSAGAYWVTQADMDALDEAIAVAEAARGTMETRQDVADAVEKLEAAVSIFNDAKQETIDEQEAEEVGDEIEKDIEEEDETNPIYN